MDIPRVKRSSFRLSENFLVTIFFDVLIKISIETLKRPLSFFKENPWSYLLSRNNLRRTWSKVALKNFERSWNTNELDDRLENLPRWRRNSQKREEKKFHTKLLLKSWSPVSPLLRSTSKTNARVWISSGKRGQVVHLKMKNRARLYEDAD